jgi:anti-sigma B factor antagonist
VTERFELTAVRDGDVAVVALRGEVDVYAAPVLRTQLQELAVGDAGTVAVDLSGASFLDSSGVGVLIGARKRLAAGGRRLVLRSPSPEARGVIAVLGLEEYFGLEATDFAPQSGVAGA